MSSWCHLEPLDWLYRLVVFGSETSLRQWHLNGLTLFPGYWWVNFEGTDLHEVTRKYHVNTICSWYTYGTFFMVWMSFESFAMLCCPMFFTVLWLGRAVSRSNISRPRWPCLDTFFFYLFCCPIWGYPEINIINYKLQKSSFIRFLIKNGVRSGVHIHSCSEKPMYRIALFLYPINKPIMCVKQ